LSPGVVAGVPVEVVHNEVECELVPRVLARLKKAPEHRRRLVQCGTVATESVVLTPPPGQVGPPCVLALWWCPGCQEAGLIACTLAELTEALPVWRPDVRDFLKARVAALQARHDDQDDGRGDDDD
jgi:hypothetical protein